MVLKVWDFKTKIWVEKDPFDDFSCMVNTVLDQMSRSMWNETILLGATAATMLFFMFGEVDFRGSTYKNWIPLRKVLKEYLGCAHNVMPHAEDADIVRATQDATTESPPAIGIAMLEQGEDSIHAELMVPEFAIKTVAFLKKLSENSHITGGQLYKKVVSQVDALRQVGDSANLSLNDILGIIWDNVTEVLPEMVVGTVKHLPEYYMNHKKMPAECDGIIPDMVAVEHILRFRTSLTLAVMPGLENSPISVHTVEWIQVHAPKVSLADLECSDVDTWRQMWSWLLAPMKEGESVAEVMAKRLDAFTELAAVEDLPMDLVSPVGKNGDALISPDVEELVVQGKNQSEAPVAPKNKLVTSVADAPVPAVMWMQMFDLAWVQPDGTVKQVPMRCLHTCLQYIRGQVNELNCRFDTADSGYSSLLLHNIKAGDSGTSKVPYLRCKMVPKCLRLNLIGEVHYTLRYL